MCIIYLFTERNLEQYQMSLKNIISIKRTALLVSILITVSVQSQQTLNTKFEILSVEGTSRPWGWDVENFSDVTIELDTDIIAYNYLATSASYSNNTVCISIRLCS